MKPTEILCIIGLGLLWMVGAANIVSSLLGNVNSLSYLSIEKFFVGLALVILSAHLEKEE